MKLMNCWPKSNWSSIKAIYNMKLWKKCHWKREWINSSKLTRWPYSRQIKQKNRKNKKKKWWRSQCQNKKYFHSINFPSIFKNNYSRDGSKFTKPVSICLQKKVLFWRRFHSIKFGTLRRKIRREISITTLECCCFQWIKSYSRKESSPKNLSRKLTLLSNNSMKRSANNTNWSLSIQAT